MLRSGNQINPVINETQRRGGPLVGPAQPAPLSLQSSNYWAQGVHLRHRLRVLRWLLADL
jgi:hypothetical protein